MGGGHSKNDALYTNDLQEIDDDDQEHPFQCLGCLFPNAGSSPASSRHSSRHGLSSRSGSRSKLLGDDGFGTPIPDTPEPIRRIRDAAMEKYYNESSHHEEKKTSGGSFSRVDPSFEGQNDWARMSKFPGLEKEESSALLTEYEKTNGGGVRANSAEIYDGKDAETKLYQKYEICEVLGVGSTSTCHRCVEHSTGLSRACKIVDKHEIDPKYQNMMDQFYTEIKTLKNLQHPNIIQLYDVYISEDKIYIIMELMSGGELFDYVVQKGTLTEEEASRIVRKVTSALVYMHSKNVIHRDLKPENLLLAHKPRSSHDIEVKIIDFGLSKILSDGPVTSSFLGTRGYLAPEMIQRRNYTKSVDAWALGVIIFVLLCGCLPFDDDCQSIPNSPDLRTKFTLRFPRWAKDLSSSARDLLNRLLNIDPSKRYTAEDAMEHPWVKGDTASKDSLLQSPGRIKPSPGKNNVGKTTQATKDHVSQMVANRAIANAQLAGARTPKVHVRKTSI
eukprot:CAMPEP_0183714356 /NCGR_PEP_ID=MMETSP0737-20130205/8892_1 /TAXON_ID=385413 /ORGANISM="Thalassiosira miniscula, Strain CCMP1093" /LENGTH=501 /DNA_ID=CAMNT_0025943263 /DNA_START=195 /DNA_END=1703 /DNA_ORIENTATION=+